MTKTQAPSNPLGIKGCGEAGAIAAPVAVINASPVGGEFARDSLVETLRTMNWRVTGAWSSPKKVRGENVDDEVAAVIREAIDSLA